MDRIYIYDGDFAQGAAGDPLLRKAAALYLSEKGEAIEKCDCAILRPEQGKPCFENHFAEFSLSHSGKLWMCMFSDDSCGLDVQMVRDCDYEKLARRFFPAEEQHYVDLWGISGFFDLWVRREAFGKCTGEGFFSPCPILTDEAAELKQQVEWGGSLYRFSDIFISDDIKCAACSTGAIEGEMRCL